MRKTYIIIGIAMILLMGIGFAQVMNRVTKTITLDKEKVDLLKANGMDKASRTALICDAKYCHTTLTIGNEKLNINIPTSYYDKKQNRTIQLTDEQLQAQADKQLIMRIETRANRLLENAHKSGDRVVDGGTDIELKER